LDDLDTAMMEIRAEAPGDIAAIHALVAACFPTDAEARLIDALRAAGRLSLSLLAVEDGQVIGHIGFSPMTGLAGGLGLAPLAVQANYRRRGIGAQLARAGLAACADFGARFVVVLGDPAYYGRFGFAPASQWGLSGEYGGGDAFQALELIPGTIRHGVLLIRYAPEFAAL